DNGSLLVQDNWYETPKVEFPQFMVCTNAGTFTLHGANIAPAQSQLALPAVDIRNFAGKLAFLGARFVFPNTYLSLNDPTGAAQLLLLGSLSTRVPTFDAPVLPPVLLENFQLTPNGFSEAERQGDPNPAFLIQMLAQTRNTKPQPLVPRSAD